LEGVVEREEGKSGKISKTTRTPFALDKFRVKPTPPLSIGHGLQQLLEPPWWRHLSQKLKLKCTWP